MKDQRIDLELFQEGKMRRHSHIEKAPQPFFDTLDYMKNPVKTPVTPEDIHRTLEVGEPEAVMDYQVASEFIFTYRGSVETFRQYRKTLEQLLAWCWLVNEKPIRKPLHCCQWHLENLLQCTGKFFRLFGGRRIHLAKPGGPDSAKIEVHKDTAAGYSPVNFIRGTMEPCSRCRGRTCCIRPL